jgi:hypothetical protein
MFKHKKELKTAIIITKNPEKGGYKMGIDFIGDEIDKEMAEFAIESMARKLGIHLHLHV